jgi:hypothetical protein
MGALKEQGALRCQKISKHLFKLLKYELEMSE